MGVSQSVSHFAHPEPGHRFKRVESKDLSIKVTCRMCWEEINTGVAYHCQRCVAGFFIHDVCFHRQQTIDSHWAHAAHPSHPLTLSTTAHLQVQQGLSSSDDPAVCTLYAEALDPRAFAYVCSRRAGDDGHDCHGFSAHPSCCIDFPRKLMDLELHRHELTLLSPPHHHDGRRRRRSACLNPQCRSRGKRLMMTAAPWSYQCPTCNVHICLPCRVQRGGEGNGPRKNQQQPGRRYGKDPVEIVGCMGDAMGTFGRRFTCACMGNPGA